MVKIILIGRCCRISFDTIDINLKTETSLFEWVWTDTLNEINTIIKKLINNEPILINRFNDRDVMADTNIITFHYLNKNYEEIVIKRSKRFMNNIINNKDILFIRDDVLDTIKYEEIQEFYSLIKTINPLLSFKMLLLSNSNNFNEIIYPNLHHKIYEKSLYKTYIKDCYIIDNNIQNTNIHDISDDEL
jgi:predicted Zn-dependent protease with MMP-like domain